MMLIDYADNNQRQHRPDDRGATDLQALDQGLEALSIYVLGEQRKYHKAETRNEFELSMVEESGTGEFHLNGSNVLREPPMSAKTTA
eukprot:271518-Heterocapsa_arctica.AAC.1